MDLGGTVLASVEVNTEAGSYLTFAFPVILFCVIGAILYVLLFSRPHPRVPARRFPAAAGAVSAATTTTGSVAGEPAGAGDSEHGTTEGTTPTGTAPTEGTGSAEGTGSTEGTEAGE
jgi:hypothetical protein